MGSSIRQLVNRHLSVNDVPAAFRTVTSDDIFCGIYQFPQAHRHSMTTSSQYIGEVIRSFSGISIGDVDGLRPIHLQDLFSNQTAEAGNRMILSLTFLVNTFLNGQISDFARILFFRANLIALWKKDGGICPITVGNVLRRLASKVSNHFASHKITNLLRPVQLGGSARNSHEAAVHSARIITKPPNYILAKLDIKNSIRRDVPLRKYMTNCPEIFRLAHGSPIPFMANGRLIWSESCLKQGDPLGPLLLLASYIKSNFNIWYLDDATIAGDPRSVCDDIKRCSSMLAGIGLFLNQSKSELVNLGLAEMVFLCENQCINSILENVSFAKEDIIPLDSPLTSAAIRSPFLHKLSIFKTMIEKLSLLDRHPAYFLLRNCFSMPKLMYLLRSSPTF